MLQLDEIIIVSRTPIIFFKEELSGVGERYARALRERLESHHFRTIYFMSEREVGRIASGLPSIPSQVENMMSWKQKWDQRKNISALVVNESYFPASSFWIGKLKEETVYTLVKIRFEDEKKVSPIWLGIEGALPKMDSVLNLLKEHSETFGEFLERRMSALASLEP